MSIKANIDDILTQLCNSNNHSLDCINEITIESYKDFSNSDLPISGSHIIRLFITWS